jgi:hypothetical protein
MIYLVSIHLARMDTISCLTPEELTVIVEVLYILLPAARSRMACGVRHPLMHRNLQSALIPPTWAGIQR